jgi:hypothetical protein
MDARGSTAVGQRMLGTVTRYLIKLFFGAVERRIAPQSRKGWRRLLAKLLSWFGRHGGEP